MRLSSHRTKKSRRDEDDVATMGNHFIMLDDGYIHAFGVSLDSEIVSSKSGKKTHYVKFGIELERVDGSTEDLDAHFILLEGNGEGRKSGLVRFTNTNDAPNVYMGDILKFTIIDQDLPGRLGTGNRASIVAHLHIPNGSQQELSLNLS